MVRQARMLYVLIRQQEGITRQVLSEQLDLPATSLNRMLDRQVQAGLIEEYDLAVSTGGRRPGLYRLKKDGRYLLGLDWTDQAGCLVLADTCLQVIATKSWPEFGLWPPLEQLAAIRLVMPRLLDEHGIAAHQLLGLGLSCPSTTDTQATLSDLIHLLEAGGDLTVCPTASRDAAFFAGLWQIREKASENMLFLTFGDSARGGMALKGLLHDGLLTTLPIDPTIVPLPDKSGGHELGQLATIPGLTRRFQRSKEDPDLGWIDLCQAVADGKKKARQLMSDAAYAAAAVAFDMACLTGSNQILMSGEVVDGMTGFAQEVRTRLGQFGKRRADPFTLTFVAGDPENNAIGACACVLESRLNAAPDSAQREWAQPPEQHDGPADD
jgi:predicted NBD/HSP70 family sugar kinase